MTDRTIKFKQREATKSDARLNVAKTYKMYVNGAFPRTESGRFYSVKNDQGEVLANACWASRKDVRDAVTSARAVQPKWASLTAYNRSQILYRIAEMLEARKTQFVEEITSLGESVEAAEAEVSAAIDRLVYFAGWADKYQQVFSAVNPVASSHFNFSVLEATGVVAILAPESSSLLGLVSLLAPVIVGGNTCVLIASHSKPLSAVTFGEVLQTSDVPAGVVNILTGPHAELAKPLGTHMDVNAMLISSEVSADQKKELELACVGNLKRFVCWNPASWTDSADCENPYWIADLQEVKTTWHPIGI